MTGNRLLASLAVAVTSAAVIAGLIVSGSPQRQRELRLDERRVSDLRNLSSAISRHFRDTGRLPETLDRLVDGRILSTMPRDPETNETYAYEIDGPREFRLCAEFLLASHPPGTGEFWSHTDGQQCFSFDYSSLRLE